MHRIDFGGLGAALADDATYSKRNEPFSQHVGHCFHVATRIVLAGYIFELRLAGTLHFKMRPPSNMI